MLLITDTMVIQNLLVQAVLNLGINYGNVQLYYLQMTL